MAELMQTLIGLEEARRDGWLNRDREALRGMMAADFVEVNYFGRLSRDELLDELFPDLTLEVFTMEEFALIEASPDVAVLTYRCFEQISYKGARTDGEFSVAATYTNREGRWLLLLWQITPFTG